jgi:RNA polymerase sigma factor (sigma-70 family)
MVDGGTLPVPSGNEGGVPLADRIRMGDPIAEKELVDTYSRAVLLVAVHRTRDPKLAQDLAQDALVSVIEALRKGQIHETDSLSGFVQGKVRNVITDFLSTKARSSGSDLKLQELAALHPAEKQNLEELQRRVGEQLAAFSPAEQKILLWSVVSGDTSTEIAHRLNMTPEAVRRRRAEALKQITQPAKK